MTCGALQRLLVGDAPRDLSFGEEMTCALTAGFVRACRVRGVCDVRVECVCQRDQRARDRDGALGEISTDELFVKKVAPFVFFSSGLWLSASHLRVFFSSGLSLSLSLSLSPERKRELFKLGGKTGAPCSSSP